MGKDVIIACDFKNSIETLNFLDKFTDEKPFLKIGSFCQDFILWSHFY